MTQSTLLSWYVAQLKPNGTSLAERNLRRQGFLPFMPMVERDERSSRCFERTLKPLFPGYLFVGFNPDVFDWHPINSTRGIARLVSFGVDGPRPVQHTLIQTLQDNTDEAGIFRTSQPLTEGDEVIVLTGPFADQLACIHKLDDTGRAWILLNLLGRETRVGLHRSQLARA